MTQLTAAELVTVRDANQHTELYIAKYTPQIVLQARINDAGITKGSRSIAFDSVSNGSYLGVVAGQTLYIGSTAGGDDIGRVRVRSITSGTITVAQDNDIHYSDNDYLTVRDFHEFWPVFPRNIANTGTLTYSFYKDYDISLTDENTNFDPVVIMGPDFAGFFDTFPNIYFTATGSYTVDGSTITSYAWTFPSGCTPTSSSSGTPGNVAFPRAGMYTVKCTVTASTGKTSTGYRHIALLDRNTGSYLPITDSAFNDLDGEWGSGYILKITVRNRANEFKDGDLVILFAEDYYDFTKQSFGGYPGRAHIVFTGYVSSVKTEYNAFDSESQLVIKGIAAYMTNKEMFTLEMYDVDGTPSDWSEIEDMTINKMLNHFFRWHTTLLQMADFTHILTGEGAYRDNWVQTSKGEISNIIGDFLKNRVLGAFSSDRQGRCFAEVDYQLILTGSRPASVMTFENTDWVGKPDFNEIIEQPIAGVLLGGQAYDPPTYTGTAFLSRAPGELQTYIGKSQNVSGLSLTSQDNVNELSGLYYAKMNSRIPEMNIELSNNMRNIDVAKQEFYTFTIPANYTYRYGSTAYTTRLLPRKISYKLDNFVLKGTVSFEPETSGPPGDTIIIPVDVPDDTIDHCVEFPEDCEPPCEGDCDGSPCINCEGDGNTVYVWTASRVGRTTNYLASSPNWTRITDGLSGTIIDGILDPFDPANSAYTLTTAGVYRTTNLATTATWTLVCSAATMLAALSGWSSATFGNISASIAGQGVLWVSAYTNGGYTGSRIAIGAIRTANAFSTINGSTAEDSTTGDTCGPKAYVQASNRLASYGFLVPMYSNRIQGMFESSDSNASWVYNGLAGAAFEQNYFGVECAYAGSDAVLGEKIMYTMQGNTAGDIYKSSDYGSSFSLVKSFSQTFNRCTSPGAEAFVRFINVATWDEDDVIILIKDDGGNQAIIARSTDGCSTFDHETAHAGTSWEAAKALGRWPYNPNRAFILHASAILYSTDGGINWSNKNGDWTTVMGGAFANPIQVVPLWIQP